jgi:nucleoside-diphosphate-sugar epimerase
MTNYLVTGGLGFIGSALVDRLSKKKNNYIYILDNKSRERKYEKYKKKNIKYIYGDIRFAKLEFLNKIDTVYHLAYINGTVNFYRHPRDVMDVGINGTVNLINQINKKGKKVKKFIYASSSEVYQQIEKIPTNENTALRVPDIKNPRFTYGGSKILGEQLTWFYLNSKIKKIIFRPHNFYGANMGYNHIIPEIFKKIYLKSKKLSKKKISLKIEGTGNETRSFCYIDDAIDAILKCETVNKSDIFNIGNNDEIKIIDLVKKILSILNLRAKITKGPLKKGSVLRRCPDIKKISKIGYKKKYNLNQGLKKTLEWYIQNIENK